MVDKEKGYKTRTYLEKDAPHLVSTKAKLDKIGKGMCLAKWTQSTIHLQLGRLNVGPLSSKLLTATSPIPNLEI